MTGGRRLHWGGDGRGLHAWTGLPPEPLRVVDSWLVAGGRARAEEHHLLRFARAAASVSGIEQGTVLAFGVTAAEAARRVSAAEEARLFPRLELRGARGCWWLGLWLRPAPPPSATVRLWVDPRPDRRRSAACKGADLAYLGRLQRMARRIGADEAVLVDAGGAVVEGSTTSLLWWRGATLCAPPPGPGLLPSVTRGWLLDRAATVAPVSFERCRPEELGGLEVWAVNALHGIRPVTGWLGRPIEAGAPHHAAEWTRALAAAGVPGAVIPADAGDETVKMVPDLGG